MINKVILIGNLGKDPEVRKTQSGESVASFSLATSEKYTDREWNKQTKTEWHNIVAWKKLADLVGQYLKKGSRVYLEGKITYRSYETDGVKKYITEIILSGLRFLSNNEKSTINNEHQVETNTDDDLPF